MSTPALAAVEAGGHRHHPPRQQQQQLPGQNEINAESPSLPGGQVSLGMHWGRELERGLILLPNREDISNVTYPREVDCKRPPERLAQGGAES